MTGSCTYCGTAAVNRNPFCPRCKSGWPQPQAIRLQEASQRRVLVAATDGLLLVLLAFMLVAFAVWAWGAL